MSNWVFIYACYTLCPMNMGLKGIIFIHRKAHRDEHFQNIDMYFMISSIQSQNNIYIDSGVQGIL